MQVDTLERALHAVPARVWLAVGVVILGLMLGWLVEQINRRLLERAGVPEAIEGTAFERTAREFGTSTVGVIAQLSAYFIIILAIIVALTVAEIDYVSDFWASVAGFLPNLFLAAFIVIVGIVIGDKVELLVAERLRGVKLPEVGVIPTLAKYSVFYVAVLIALGQVGVATLALVVLLGVYALALVLFAAIATKDLLASAAAGTYLLLHQPYSIGDEVVIGESRGIVQEVDLFVTHVEAEGEEYIVPNATVFREGVVRVRD